MQTHSPAPWDHSYGSNVIRAADGKILVHEVGPYSRGGGAPHDERDANARLIAAAPDLLDTAQTMLAMYDKCIGVVWARSDKADAAADALRAAITKATGDAR